MSLGAVSDQTLLARENQPILFPPQAINGSRWLMLKNVAADVTKKMKGAADETGIEHGCPP